MSRVGRMPINIPDKVKVEIADGLVTVSGPLGTLKRAVDKRITVKVENNEILVSRSSEENLDKSMHGLYRALIQNMVTGVTDGYKKTLVIAGVGYKVVLQGNKLVLSIGFSKPVEVVQPEGIKFECPDANTIAVSGIDNDLVGETASKIRGLRPVEPYHLYGIHYSYEHLVKKEGKKAAAATSAGAKK